MRTFITLAIISLTSAVQLKRGDFNMSGDSLDAATDVVGQIDAGAVDAPTLEVIEEAATEAVEELAVVPEILEEFAGEDNSTDDAPPAPEDAFFMMAGEDEKISFDEWMAFANMGAPQELAQRRQNDDGSAPPQNDGGEQGDAPPQNDGGEEGEAPPHNDGGEEGNAPPHNDRGEEGEAPPHNDGGEEGDAPPHNDGGEQGDAPPSMEDAFNLLDTNSDDFIDFSEWMAFADMGGFEEAQGEGERQGNQDLEDLMWACSNMDMIPEESRADVEAVCSVAAEYQSECFGEEDVNACVAGKLQNHFGEFGQAEE